MTTVAAGLPFTKMHGIGNDYVFVDLIAHPDALAGRDLAALARSVSDRHYGIGADGLILLEPPVAGGDVRMRMYNADGSEAEMCGNGVRGLCKLAYDRGHARGTPMRVETGAGVLALTHERGPDDRVRAVTVDMGIVTDEPAAIPLASTVRTPLVDAPWADHLADVLEAGDAALVACGLDATMTCLAVGNPHLVLTASAVAKFPLERVGPRLEHHPLFPNRINVHVVQVHDAGELTMRTWERGSGITLACGTGASAVVAATTLTGRTAPEVLAHLPGGDLRLRFDPHSRHVWMTGPTVEVFTGVWNG